MKFVAPASLGLYATANAATANQTNIAILNLTPYTWHQSAAPHSYQLSNWEGQWHTDIAPGVSSVQATIAVSFLNNNPADSSGEVSYQVTDDSGSKVQLQVKGGGSFPKYTFDVNAALQGISTSNNGQGSTLRLGWEDASWTPFILGGKKGSLVGNNPPTNWMAQNLKNIGCLTLQSLVLPGSHDAGMSQIRDKSEFSTAANTQTQTLNVKDQLNNGVRFFDIRPSLKGGAYKTGHWSNTNSPIGWQGSNGQSITDIISNVNDFTANNNELIVLYLSHSLHIDNNYASFDDNDWDGVLHQLQGLNHLYQSNVNNLLDVQLSDFIQKGPAVVVVCDERDQNFLASKGYSGKGFWPQAAFRKYDSYADSSDMNTMRSDQHGKFKNAANHQDQLFLLSWTMTLNAQESANPLDSIRQRAEYANNRLFEVGNVPQTGPYQWTNWGQNLIPNIILVDNVVDNKLAALAVAMNRQYHDCAA